MSKAEPQYSFQISLSVLNHLGRQLYRSFATVLGEAISNAWDADARNVWIYLEPERDNLWIKDDGIGMSADDFQNKFLRIGYSKRRGGITQSRLGRPFVGRKGIGKLALLSCAKRISVLSKVKRGEYVGGAIDNSELDEAITEDLVPQEYPLEQVDGSRFSRYKKGHTHGTIIYFEGLSDGVKHSSQYLRQLIALYFRFSLLDKNFRIFLDDHEITHRDLQPLVEKTEFLWKIGRFDDPFVRALTAQFAKEPGDHETKRVVVSGAKGFLASVMRPRDLKVLTTEERAGVDLFVNGRLRERDILKHIPTARVVESYLYGQVHFDALDDKQDRFTSSREGIVADDPKFTAFLERLRKVLLKVVEDWDAWRLAHREEGDSENESISTAQRASEGLYNAIVKNYEPRPHTEAGRKVEAWVASLSADAAFNFESYAECFVAENLVRKYIEDRSIPLSPEAKAESEQWRRRETESKGRGNISIEIRRKKSLLNYLSMEFLANLVDKPQDRQKEAALARDALEFKPMRDAVAHTALLTDAAKVRLRTVRENIKGRIKTLLASDPVGANVSQGGKASKRDASAKET